MNSAGICSKCGRVLLGGSARCPACASQQPPNVPIRKSQGRLIVWICLGTIVLIGLILMVVSMRLFLKYVSLVSTGLFVLSIMTMLLTFRKKKKIAPWPLVITILTSLITLWIYSLLLGVHFGGAITMATLIFGALIGSGWALTTPVRANKGIVEREGNLWYLAVWGAIFVLNQVVIMLTGRPPQIAMLLLLLGTGTVLGNSGSLIWQYYRARKMVTAPLSG